MLNEEVIEQLTERLVDKIEEENLYILKKIGSNISKIKTLTPSEAQQLAQVLKYGGSYNEIVRELQRLTNLSQKEIDEIFSAVAKKNQLFAKKFYDYKGIDFIPYAKNVALQNQVKALAKITKNEFMNIAKTSVIGYHTLDNKGNVIFKEISNVYKELIDEAVLNVAQGKETFDTMLYRQLKRLGSDGLRYVDYESGKTMRLDSAVRMNLQGALRNLSNELQQQFGEEYGADGVEISVHLNPAPDHAEVQGKQFSKGEFNKFQNDIDSVSYDGTLFTADFEGHDRRAISEYNCYHYIFDIVLGVSEPRYSDKELKEINEKNEKGFEYEGKHYTMYEGQQLQRKIEAEIRKQKDLQILGKASDNEQLMYEAQGKINLLMNKYNNLCNISGLKKRAERLRVSNYKKIAIKK